MSSTPVIITAALTAAVLLAVYIYKESRGFRIVRYRLINDKLKKPHFKFAFISDLHGRVHGADMESVFKAIDDEKPDAVFLAGDMVTTGRYSDFDADKALGFMGKLAARYPVYYGIGNHEEKLRRRPDLFPGLYEDYCTKLQKIGISMLTDVKVSLYDAGIDIYGLDLEHEYYRKFKINPIPDDLLKKKFGDCDPSRVSILIAHNPEQFDGYAKWHPDIVLSGHVHGGIISLPFLGGVISPQLKLFPKYDAGLFERDGSKMILSRGLGTHTIPVRINNKAEAVIVDIFNEDKR
ncbi:MAG: metallophosphoesterase [Lachnospiraceae bacterium]|nr:metallophosphoesterase [Lachnospiraceae bacterium]